jgi:PTH1 family peptidyl-tRNA hydrolase
MNESGQAIKRLLERYQIETPGLVVIHDDADLPKGEIRLSQNRGTAGHKGLESIVKALGTKDFARIRLGVRPKNYVPGSKLLARFVLKKISAREKEVVRETIQKASQALEKILRE